mmetsp:Transcript_15371/g.33150  ORF Transcript_15371/g.33150 Transcript_15371/m.33150 type:complete len:97 (-) Transcript_15371:152-442(-)
MTDVVLNDRERTVVRLLSQGYTPREMAREIWPNQSTTTQPKQQQQQQQDNSSSNTNSDKEGTTAAIHRIIKGLCERTETASKTELIRWARKVGYIP